MISSNVSYNPYRREQRVNEEKSNGNFNDKIYDSFANVVNGSNTGQRNKSEVVSRTTSRDVVIRKKIHSKSRDSNKSNNSKEHPSSSLDH